MYKFHLKHYYFRYSTKKCITNKTNLIFFFFFFFLIAWSPIDCDTKINEIHTYKHSFQVHVAWNRKICIKKKRKKKNKRW